MDKLLQEPSHHFSAFYLDNSLLLQFIITDFIRIHPFFSEINALIDQYFHPLDSHDIPFNAFSKILGLLVGNPSTDKQQTCPFWTKGLLTKLKEHSEQLPRNSDHKDKHHLDLHMALYQAWSAALHNLELLNALNHTEESLSKKIRLIKAFKRGMVDMNRRYKQALRFLASSFKGQLKNENVLLCLLKGKATLSQIYGSDYIQKTFKCPIKPDQFLKLIASKYRERGFDRLPADIEQPYPGISSL